MKKRILSVLVILTMLMSYAVTVSATENNNVALGRNFVTAVGKELTGWTDGVLDATLNSASAQNALHTKAGDAANDEYAVLDLGATYDLTQIKVVAANPTPVWHYSVTTFYGSNDLSAGIAGATQLVATAAAADTSALPTLEYSVSGSYRYIWAKHNSEWCILQEVEVYANQETSEVTFAEATVPTVVSNVDNGETVTLTYTGAVNTVSAGAGIVCTDANGAKAVASFYQVDDTTIALDPAFLTANTAYTLTVGAIDDANGNVIEAPAEATYSFTTGMTARVPHKDGKFISSVSTNKTITSSGGGNLSAWIDGDATTVIGTTNETDIAMIDMGKKYSIEALQIKTQAAWTSDNIGIYLTNDKDIAVETLAASDYTTLTLKTGNILDYADVSKFADAEGYQYIAIWDTGSDNQKPTLYEVYAYAYTEPFEINNVALGKPVVTANGRKMSGWTNGVLETTMNGATTENVFKLANDGAYAVLDLGAEMELTAIETVSMVVNWNYWTTTFYGAKDLSTGLSGAVKLSAVENVNLVSQTPVKKDVSGKYRYIYIVKDSGQLEMMELAVFAKQTPSNEVPTVDFKGMQEAATNIDTEERITVTFPEGTDMSSVNTATVYAVAQEAKGGVLAGDIHHFDFEVVEGTTIAIDVAKLAGVQSYKIVVNDVVDANGCYINFESEVFKTAAIANIAYPKNFDNVVRGIVPVQVGGGSKTSALERMTDGDIIAGGQHDTEDGSYIYFDLGKKYSISSVAAIWNAGYWTNSGTSVYLTNDISNIASLTESDFTKFNYASKNLGAAGVMDYADVQSSEPCRYVVLKDFSSNDVFSLRELFVFAVYDISDVTISANASEGVTNVGRNDVVTVDFTGDVDMDSVVYGTVFAVAQEAKGKVAVGDKLALTFKKSGDKQITIDTKSFDGLMSYQIMVDGALDTAGKTVRTTSEIFTTGIIANIDVADGKVLTNVAEGKTIIPIDVKTEYGWDADIQAGDAEGWIDGDISVSGYTIEFREARLNAEGKYDWAPNVDHIVIDLGKQYKIESVGAVWSAGAWTNKGARIYLTNDLQNVPANGASFVKAEQSAGASGVVDSADVKALFNDEAGYRYVVIKNPIDFVSNSSGGNKGGSTSISAREFMVFAYEEANDVAFSKNITLDKRENAEGEEETYVKSIEIRANADNAGANTVVIAEYDGEGRLLSVNSATCVDGKAKAELSYNATSEYKAFLVDSLGNLSPVIDAIDNTVE